MAIECNTFTIPMTLTHVAGRSAMELSQHVLATKVSNDWVPNQDLLYSRQTFYKLSNRSGHSIHIYVDDLYDEALRRWRSGLERWPRKQKVGCSNSGRDRPKS